MQTDSSALMETVDLDQAAEVLKVVAHPLRLAIIDLLMRDKLSVGQLAEIMNQPQAAISGHLSQLKARGVVQATREGRSCYYHVIHPSAKNVIRCIRKHGTTV